MIREGAWVTVALTGIGVPVDAEGYGQVVTRKTMGREVITLGVAWSAVTLKKFPRLPPVSTVPPSIARVISPPPAAVEGPVRAMTPEEFAMRMARRRYRESE